MIAIPATKNNANALIDDRFGRCPFFCFYDTKSKTTEFKENSLRNSSGGVGPQVVQFLATSGVNTVYAVEIGPKAKDLLDKFKMEIHITKSGKSIHEIIEMLNH